MAGESVLLVDDEGEFVSALKERLEIRGIRVKGVADGPAAIEAVRHHAFDLIILDLQMPGMDGIEVLRQVMALDADAQVILLTGHATIDRGVTAIKEGAVDFIEKPPALADLLDRIGKAAANRVLLTEKRSAAEVEKILRRRGW